MAHRPFEYRVGFTLADNITEITKFDNPDGQIDQFYKGKRLGEIWGYTVEGLLPDRYGIPGSCRPDESKQKNPAQLSD